MIEVYADSASYETFFHFYRLTVDERLSLPFPADTSDQTRMAVLVSQETHLASQ
jgi:hypothetical protein